MEASTLHAPARLLAPAWRRFGSDETLVAAVRAGDARAFETVFDRFNRPLLSFCRHMLGNREEGEDALQQTFMAAYRDLVSSTKPIQLRPWLYTIARNQCLSVLRARRDKVPLEDAEPATEGLAAEVQQRDDVRNMLVDLRRLPDDQRAALVLAELGSLSHEEIADVVGCPRAKVKALVFQARRSLAASRLARETPCSEVREQLSTLTGGALRRASLRRHVRECEGCREFDAEVRRQRRTMAALLPVVPSAGLKGAILAEIGIGGGGTAAIGAGALGGLGATGGGAGKMIALGLVVVGAGTAGAVAEQELTQPRAPVAAQTERTAQRAPVGIAGPAVLPAVRQAVQGRPASAPGLAHSSPPAANGSGLHLGHGAAGARSGGQGSGRNASGGRGSGGGGSGGHGSSGHGTQPSTGGDHPPGGNGSTGRAHGAPDTAHDTPVPDTPPGGKPNGPPGQPVQRDAPVVQAGGQDDSADAGAGNADGGGGGTRSSDNGHRKDKSKH